ncbi:putative long-chain-alcohol O-fatty-acyltransferase 5 [Morella rubra]|uniref:Putative long-chain-alcohol O-fatty-acyltransferase 5 n=1 Tax=Morella rubra TaxID=262757 RepID=A0A6A1WPA4_9ROSI|nr:putative long-chain-alcohol O-fatty-acyltransferase 5 [Morella rubra]
MVTASNGFKRIHPTIVIGLYCYMVYLLPDIVLGICNAIVRGILGMELELPSDEPYLSTSLLDFWGRRWNLMVTNILQQAVYIPVRSVSESLLGTQKWAPVPAVLAAFTVSCLMHELLFFYVACVAPTWEVMWFFLLQRACLVLEFRLKKFVLSPLAPVALGSLGTIDNRVCHGHSRLVVLPTTCQERRRC